MTGRALAAAAEALVGVPFRLGGRDPAGGLDCLGLFAVAMERIGRVAVVPAGYSLKVRRLDQWLPDPALSGLAEAAAPFMPGDVILLQPAGAQFHLAIAGPGGGWIHAHAGLRRVVSEPAMPRGELVRHWRLQPQAESLPPWQP